MFVKMVVAILSRIYLYIFYQPTHILSSLTWVHRIAVFQLIR